MKNKYKLPSKFVGSIVKGGETGMGWTVARVTTTDGNVYKNVLVSGDEIIGVYGHSDLPFKIKDIKSLDVTHRKDYPENFKRFYTFEEMQTKSQSKKVPASK
jgi:hypothetical protein